VSLSQPVFWHQGLFLQPQHLQAADRYHTQLAAYLLQRTGPHGWGLLDLTINEAAIQNGLLDLQRFECMMRDGTLVSFPDNAVITARQFDSVWRDRNHNLPVYVGLKHISRNDSNVTVVEAISRETSLRTRFVSNAAGEPVSDSYEGGKIAKVKTLRYVLTLFFGSEVDDAEDYEVIHIADLMMEGERFQLDERQIAPSLVLGASPALINHLNTLKHNLMGRAALLNSYKELGSGESSSYNPAAITNRLAVQVLSRYVPRIIQYIEAAQVHPLEVYGALRALISELSVFSDKVAMDGSAKSGSLSLPHYEHNAIGACFQAAMDMIGLLLNELTVSPELVVQLRGQDDGKFVGTLPKEFFERNNSVYFLLRTSEASRKFLDSFINFSKLGAANQVEVYARRALPGVPVIHLQGKPIGISSQPNTHYFMLEREGYEWGYVEDSGQIGLIWNEAPDDLVAEIVMVRG
jgi:type VI secretion system protein ImpJ